MKLTTYLKVWSVILCTLFSIKSQGQETEKFHIKGTLKNFENTYENVYLIFPPFLKKEIHESSIINNQFEFRGDINEVVGATLTFNIDGIQTDAREFTTLIISPGEMEIVADQELRNLTATGDNIKAEKDFLKLDFENKKLANEINELAKSENFKSNKELQSEVSSKTQQLLGQTLQGFIEYVKSNPRSSLSPFLVYTLFSTSMVTPTMSDSLYDIVKNNSNKGFLIKQIDSLNNARLAIQQKVIEQAAKQEASTPKIGTIAKGFTQDDPLGNPISLSDYKGQYVLLDFWASWCMPCRAENPNLLKAYNSYKDKGFTVLGISLDGKSMRDKWLDAITKDNLPWTQVSDLKGGQNEVALLYGVSSIPMNYLIDPDGFIIAKNLRGDQLHQTLSSIFDN